MLEMVYTIENENISSDSYGIVETMLNYEPTKGEDALGNLHNIPPPMFSARMTVTDYG
jgi:hypothetical protein